MLQPAKLLFEQVSGALSGASLVVQDIAAAIAAMLISLTWSCVDGTMA